MFDGLTYSWQDGKSCMINSATENSTAEFITDTQTFYPLAELLVFFVADAYGLLHFNVFCLRLSLASDRFSKGYLLKGERLPFEKQKTVFCKLKGHHLKL